MSGTERKRFASGPIRSAPFRSAAYRTSVAAARVCASSVREASRRVSHAILSWYERFNFMNNSLRYPASTPARWKLIRRKLEVGENGRKYRRRVCRTVLRVGKVTGVPLVRRNRFHCKRRLSPDKDRTAEFVTDGGSLPLLACQPLYRRKGMGNCLNLRQLSPSDVEPNIYGG